MCDRTIVWGKPARDIAGTAAFTESDARRFLDEMRGRLRCHCGRGSRMREPFDDRNRTPATRAAPPADHSICSSAMSSRPIGTSMPRSREALRLIARLNFFGVSE
jgi:hypothetical protein